MSSDASPIIFKRKTKSKPGTTRTTTLRSRDASPDPSSVTPTPKQDAGNSMNDAIEDVDMDAANLDTGNDSPSILISRLKNKVKRTRQQSRLSFGGDVDQEADAEPFKIKKSALSQKLALGTHPASLPASSSNTGATTGPVYDAAYLQELKANTPTARPPAVKDAMNLEADAYSVDVSMMDIDTIAEVAEDVNNTIIPSESSIKNAKEKRDRLKAGKMGGVEEDFISLSVTKREDVDKGPHPESRLVREEDEMGEGDDEYAEYTSAQERIALGKKSRKLEASKKRAAMKEMINDAEEEDEETIEWEQEQLRRGGHTQRTDPSKVKAVYKPAPIPHASPLPTLAPALDRLSARLSALTVSHAKNTTQLTSLSMERDEVDRRETELRELVEKAEEKREWFGRFGSFVEGIGGFLEEKYPLLEELEKDELALYKEKADKIRERRNVDDEDDLSWFIGRLPSPPETSKTPETDEYGRAIPRPDPSTERRNRRTERLARREDRMLRRKAQHQTQQSGTQEEGYSTDDSISPPLPYPSAIIPNAEEILSDVRAASFRDPSRAGGIAEWWGEWRDRWADVYTGAWGGLGAVSVWEFWVRFESLGWEFMGRKDGSRKRKSLEHFKWYRGLWTYSRPGAKKTKGDKDGKGAEEALRADLPLGPDGDLVASMIGTAVIPLLCRRLEAGALDVFSTWQVKALVDLVEEIEASLVEGGDDGMSKFFTLVKCISSLFERTISESQELLDKYNSSAKTLGFDPESISARQRYLARRIKLLENLLIWRRYVTSLGGSSNGGAVAAAVVHRLIDDLLQGSILPISRGGWDIGGKEAAQKVANILPLPLIPESLKDLRRR